MSGGSGEEMIFWVLVIIFPMLVVGSPASLARPGVDERDWSGADLATAPG